MKNRTRSGGEKDIEKPASEETQKEIKPDFDDHEETETIPGDIDKKTEEEIPNR